MATAAKKKYQVPESKGSVSWEPGVRRSHAEGPFMLEAKVGDPLVEQGLLERPTKVVPDDGGEGGEGGNGGDGPEAK